MVHVLCFGNLLHGDDGFGIHVHRLLAGRLAADRARLIEAGVRGIDALAMLDRPSHVVLVDALRDGRSPPGTVRVVDGDDLRVEDTESVHGGGVGWLVQAIRVCVIPAPRVTLVGAVIREIQGFIPRLSPLLADRLDAVAMLVEKLANAEDGHG